MQKVTYLLNTYIREKIKIIASVNRRPIDQNRVRGWCLVKLGDRLGVMEHKNGVIVLGIMDLHARRDGKMAENSELK